VKGRTVTALVRVTDLPGVRAIGEQRAVVPSERPVGALEGTWKTLDRPAQRTAILLASYPDFLAKY
jgi:hypothetical protein